MAKIVVIKPKDNSPPPEEGLPPWMATFADMVTLLLCFFVLLLSFANTDLDKFKELLGSVKDAFGVKVERREADFMALTPSDVKRDEIKMDSNDKRLLGLVLRIKAMLDQDDATRKSSGVKAEKDGVLVNSSSASLFQPGSSKLRPGASKILDKVISILKDHNYNLVVRGHTDNSEIRSKKYPTNWELSSARAASALRYIVEKGGIAPKRLKAVGYADTQPLVKNNTPENRRKNRRLEFFYHKPARDYW
ncbi:OmpA/MotB family protein [Maridesulfovibrio hydrothermalis]|uniref:OmpA/MotB domain protein n=1 Tax=Maridesulfovibrio hydrothermalis AM13 = DSM 14728 TaxID=1121451 RepID=L0RAQ8_9BACT|nr:OmpA family protein [Maridesulfovibrio hydrothermalis]CCO22656.1 OmpA/MotB domain protein [Maridesulfovibrio hydrothermalis AM13 = DSM 14728]